MTDRRHLSVMRAPEIPGADKEPGPQGTGIALWLAWLAAEYGPLPVYGSRSADEIIGHDAAALPG
jgi:hypothetical protein